MKFGTSDTIVTCKEVDDFALRIAHRENPDREGIEARCIAAHLLRCDRCKKKYGDILMGE